MVQAFVSDRIVAPGGSRAGALLVEGERMIGICSRSEIPAESARVECGDAAILPGLVDTHVHLNEPGRTEWEGFWTGTRAGAAGGYTTLVDMPLNCLPETTTVAALETKRAAAGAKAWVDWMAWGGVVADNQAHLRRLARAGVPGFKCFMIYPGCEGFSMVDEAQLQAALPEVAATGLPLLVHAELQEPIEAALARLGNADWQQYATYLASRPDQAEIAAIELLLRLCRQYQFRLHIVHLSTSRALPMLQAAKEEGLPVTVETCPHYLTFASEEIADGATLLKCAPPIRGRENREQLWQGLRDGIIDLVATDHSPCPPEMKRQEDRRYDLAWGGIASLSVALRVMWTESLQRGIPLEDIVRWMSTRPAALAGLGASAGALAPGRDANFVIFDTAGEQVLRPEDLHTRHPLSPYVGTRLRGEVNATYLRGKAVWRHGSFVDTPRGREIRI